MSNVYYIYLYYDNEGTPLYVGKGKDYRDTVHLQASVRQDDSYFHRKLNKMDRLGETYYSERLFTDLSEDEAFEHEIRLIALYGRRDLKTGILYNCTAGGDGTSGYVFTDEQREAQSERMRNLQADPEYRAAYEEGIRNREADPEFRAARDERWRNLQATPEYRAAYEEGMRVRNADPEFRAANAERLRNLQADPEFRAACAERMRNRHANPEFAAARDERLRKVNRARYKNNRVKAFGKLWYICDLAKKFGINYNTLRQRIKRGMDPEQACKYSRSKK